MRNLLALTTVMALTRITVMTEPQRLRPRHLRDKPPEFPLTKNQYRININSLPRPWKCQNEEIVERGSPTKSSHRAVL